MYTEKQQWNKRGHFIMFILILCLLQLPIIIALIEGKGQFISASISVVSSIGIILLWFSACLLSKIDAQGISFKFKPFHRIHRMIKWDEIQSIQVKEYSPLFEYGGWGIKHTSFGKNSNVAYNISGNKGILIVLKNGKTIMLGTQNEKEAILAIGNFNTTQKN
jgi:hypothetical protein